MAKSEPTPFLNVIALAIAILPFFATNALDRFDALGDEGKEGYMKFGIIVTLGLSYLVAITVGGAFLNIGGVTVGGLQLTGAYFLFVTLYFPTLALLLPAIDEGVDLWTDGSLNRWGLVGILLFVAAMISILVRINPVL